MSADGVFAELRKDALYFSATLGVFRSLFARDAAEVDLLNHIAAGTFWVIQNSLYDSIVLQVGRLTDSEWSGSGSRAQQNLVLQSLIRACRVEGRPEVVKGLTQRYKQVEASAKRIRVVRHKLTGHTDRGVRQGVAPVPRTRLSEFTEALESIAGFLNAFEGPVRGSETRYCPVIRGEPEVLLRCLREAIAFRREVRDWHLLGNPQRAKIRELLSSAQSETHRVT
ncbi:MAG: hypothetical protein IMZ69_07615 [Spirochaetes bacterium]|nr:hypothetical protein [Spirochaetota bacterium]